MSSQTFFTYEQERRFHAALGITKVQPTAEELIAAAEARKRQLEQARETARAFEAKTSEADRLQAELAGLREDLAQRARVDNARARVEREDASEERAERIRIAEFLKIDASQVI